MDINFDTSMHRHTISKDMEKKEGQRHHEESRFSRLSILSLIVLSMLSSLTLSRMSIISLPFSFRGIEGSKTLVSSVVFESPSSKSSSASSSSSASPRSASPSSGTSSPWCGGSAVVLKRAQFPKKRSLRSQNQVIGKELTSS